MAGPDLRRVAGPQAAALRDAGGQTTHIVLGQPSARRPGCRQSPLRRSRQGRGTPSSGSRSRLRASATSDTEVTARPDVDAGGSCDRRGAAEAAAARDAQGGPPLHLRAARRRRDLAAAGRRHAVPDAVLSDLPAGAVRDRPARGRWFDAGDDGTARHRRGAGSSLRAAHEDYLARRDAIGSLGTTVTAGGMPRRVKCLHVLVAHSLAAGPGVNPFGDEALELLADWGVDGPCVPTPDADGSDQT